MLSSLRENKNFSFYLCTLRHIEIKKTFVWRILSPITVSVSSVYNNLRQMISVMLCEEESHNNMIVKQARSNILLMGNHKGIGSFLLGLFWSQNVAVKAVLKSNFPLSHRLKNVWVSYRVIFWWKCSKFSGITIQSMRNRMLFFIFV